MKKTVKDLEVISNYKIKNDFIRIVGEVNPIDKISRYEAIKIAEDNDKDLVLLSTTNDGIGICKIIEVNKLLYEKKQKEKLQKQNNKKCKVKELRFTYNTGDHDFNFKLNHAIEFLKEGNKVKAYVFFSGRENCYVDIGNILLLKFITELGDYGKPESLPKMEGKKLWVMISPKK